MNLQSTILIKSDFQMNKPVQGQIDNQVSLNTQIAPVNNLHASAQITLNLKIKQHDGDEEYGKLEFTYFIPLEFDEDDIIDQKIIGKAVTRQMIPLLVSDANYYLTRACLPALPPNILLQILKNQ